MKKIFIRGALCMLLGTIALFGYAQPNITRVEYYVDVDPGYGNGTAISISPSTNLANVTFNIDPAAYSAGVHIVGIRAKDANGAWSHDNKWAFVKAYPDLPPDPAITNVVKVEYYVDADPGYGNAINIPVTPGTNLSDVSFNVDPGIFSVGVHVIGIRAKLANGAWSHDNKWAFVKAYPDLPPAADTPLISRVEYYFDADPGYGNGIPVAIPVSRHLSDIQISTNVTGLSSGLHALFIRAQDANGAWSHDITDSFNVPALLSSPAINVNSIAAKVSNCARDSFAISYDAKGTFNSGNTFNVELSDAAGSFSSPVSIGSYAGINNSIIKVKLPSHLPEGSGYKIRVSSTNPVVTGIAGEVSLTIHDRPAAQTVTGAADANATFSYNYSVPSVPGSSWMWIAPAASITQSANNADLIWNTAGMPDVIKIIETNQYGCVGDTSSKMVNVYNLKIENVTVSSLTPCPGSTLTISGEATGVYDAGNKFTAQLSDASGNFASPVDIGNVTASPVGLSQSISINATMPLPLLNGSGYRVRIVSNSPVVTGAANSQNILVNKPELGANKSVTLSCIAGTADLSLVYDLTGLTATYNTATPHAAPAGDYEIYVTNGNGCKDTASITVMPARTETVPSTGGISMGVNRECTDADGWTHYYNNNGTPSDFSDDIRIFSIKKNGNDIGTVGAGGGEQFMASVVSLTGAGSHSGIDVQSPFVGAGNHFYSMYRYWDISTVKQPATPINIRFYFHTSDVNDINGSLTTTANPDQLTAYHIPQGNADPSSNWNGATSVEYYNQGASPALDKWVYSDLGSNIGQAEFLVDHLSGGGLGYYQMGPVPVQLINFNAVRNGTGVRLSWNTASETNAATFRVERSTDGLHFLSIAGLPAAGNSSTLLSYQFDDDHPVAGMNFYRILETDRDGRSMYSEVRKVDMTNLDNSFKLRYNPVGNVALLQYACNESAAVQIKVVDHLGRIVMSMQAVANKGLNTFRMSTGRLAQGIYEVILTSTLDHQSVRMMKK